MNPDQIEETILNNVKSYCLSIPRIKRLIEREVINRFDVEKIVQRKIKQVRSGKDLCGMRFSDVLEKTSKAVKDEFKCYKL